MDDSIPSIDKLLEEAVPAGAPEQMSFRQFLESTPPSQWRSVTDLWFGLGQFNVPHVNSPELVLHCSTPDLCNRSSVFRSMIVGEELLFRNKDVLKVFLTYKCSNCGLMEKSFSVSLERGKKGAGRCYKYGEEPPFGPPTPARLQRLLQADRELFMKGRRCEVQGLGIGAFGYYRRVVENHRDQILDEILKVSRKINAPEEFLALLQEAKSEKQFSRAIEIVKDAIPQVT